MHYTTTNMGTLMDCIAVIQNTKYQIHIHASESVLIYFESSHPLLKCLFSRAKNVWAVSKLSLPAYIHRREGTVTLCLYRVGRLGRAAKVFGLLGAWVRCGRSAKYLPTSSGLHACLLPPSSYTSVHKVACMYVCVCMRRTNVKYVYIACMYTLSSMRC